MCNVSSSAQIASEEITNIFLNFFGGVMTVVKNLFFVSLVCFLFITSTALAEEPKLKSMKPFCVSALNGGGTILPKNAVALRLEYTYDKLDKYYEGSSRTNAPSPYAPAEISMQMLNIKFRFGLTDNLDCRFYLPVRDFDHEDSFGSRMSGSKSGFGDIAGMFRYQFMNQMKGDPFYLSAGIGFTAPTGQHDEGDVGAGAWSIGSELTFTYMHNRHRIDTEFIAASYDDGSYNHEHYKPGDVFFASVFYGYALNNYIDIGAKSRFMWMDKTENSHVKNSNSGFENIYVGPVVSLKILSHKSWMILSVPFCMERDVNGYQPTSDWYIDFSFLCMF
jgi:hypothetical protein